jgi:hypothetical protein
MKRCKNQYKHMPMKTKELQVEYQRQWIANRRAAYFIDKKCVVCGSVEKLRLHHKDRKLKVTHKVWSWSEQRRHEELAKCEVLCQQCHVAHHRKDDTYHSGLGRTPIGIKLDPTIVSDIRILKTSKKSNRKIGLMLNIPRQTIDDVVSGRTWSWV